MTRLKPCTVPGCTHRSVPGLNAGSGFCPYHWAVEKWGRAWADRCYPAFRLDDGPDQSRRDRPPVV